MKKMICVLLFLCASPFLVGCSSSNEAQPAANIVQERPAGYQKGADGKMKASSEMAPAPAKP
jgi:outer membrane lipoprotein-sorting protein